MKAVPEIDYRRQLMNESDTSDDDFMDDSTFKLRKMRKTPHISLPSSGPDGPCSSRAMKSKEVQIEPPITLCDIEKKLGSLECLIKGNQVEESNKRSRGIMEMNKVLEKIQANLTCLICKDIVSEDCIVLTCCNTLGCCQACFCNWISESETCPHCRAAMTEQCHQKMPSSLQFKSIIELVRMQTSDSSSTVLD